MNRKLWIVLLLGLLVMAMGVVATAGTAAFDADLDCDIDGSDLCILAQSPDFEGELGGFSASYGFSTENCEPYVISTVPAPGAGRVRCNATITATFSEEMNGATIMGSTFYLFDEHTLEIVPSTVGYSDTTATLIPDGPLEYERVYSVRITTEVEDVDGYGLRSDYRWSFTTKRYSPPVSPQVVAGGFHTVGLKSDGTVEVVGSNEYGQCDLSPQFWEDLIQVAAGEQHTVGLKFNGSCVAAGNDEYGQCEVWNWVDIIKVSAGYEHTVGLKSDGTLVAVGYNNHGQCDVSGWSDVIQVAAGYPHHTVGLKSNGTVVSVGCDEYEYPCDMSSWSEIIQVTTACYRTLGLRADGTIVAEGGFGGQESSWSGIIQVAAGCVDTVGLKSDGTVVADGLNEYGQCDVGDWMLLP